MNILFGLGPNTGPFLIKDSTLVNVESQLLNVQIQSSSILINEGTMSVTIVGALTEMHTRYAEDISVTISLNGVVQDIRGHTVRLVVKENPGDDENILDKEADVATSGLTGTAIWELSESDLDIDAGNYFYEISWNDGEKLRWCGGGMVPVVQSFQRS